MDVKITRLVEIDSIDDQIVTRIFSEGSFEGLALLVCDLVRHIALMKKVDEDAVWDWVDKERRHHTTDVQELH